MKKNKSKLVLNKTTVARLNDRTMSNVFGGDDDGLKTKWFTICKSCNATNCCPPPTEDLYHSCDGTTTTECTCAG